jgi:hypothetical protein
MITSENRRPLSQEQKEAWDILNARQLLELNVLFKKHEQERLDLKWRQRQQNLGPERRR